MTEPTLVVVGAGHVAASAARALRRRGFAGPVVLVGDEPDRPLPAPAPVQGAPQQGRGRRPLAARPRPGARRSDITLRTSSPVERIAADTGAVLLADGSSIAADFVVLATGGRPRRLPGVEGDRVHYIRTLADSDRLRERLQAGRRIGVLGGGFLGTEVAAAALARGAEVVVFDRDPVLLARVMGADIGAAVTATARRGAASTCAWAARSARSGPAPTASPWSPPTAPRPSTTSSCASASSRTPTSPSGSGLVVGNGVEVDAQGRTSVPTVFAAGDVAAHDHPLYGRVRVEHVDVAQRQAQAIAATARRPPVDRRATRTGSGPTSTRSTCRASGMTGVRPTDTVVTRGDLAGLAGTVFWLRDGLLVGGASDRARRGPLGRPRADGSGDPGQRDQLGDESVDLEELLEQEEVPV